MSSDLFSYLYNHVYSYYYMYIRICIGGDASIISCSRDPSPYLVKFYDAYIDTEQGICLVMEVSIG